MAWRGKRSEAHSYIPTEKWLQGRNPPLVKKEILTWYEREKKILKQRLEKPVKRVFEYTIVVTDFQTKKVLKKSKKAHKQELELWRLSKDNYEVYLRLLNERFKKLKEKYNQKMKEKNNG